MTAPQLVFDRAQVRRQRVRAAASGGPGFLLDAVAERLIERLGDVRRDFRRALLLGAHGDRLAAALAASGKAASVVAADHAPCLLPAAGARLVADEEALPFAAGAFDLAVAPLTLHWVNDLPGTLLQLRQSLAEDGLFLGVLVGGESLYELRLAWLEAEMEIESGAGPRVAPMVDLRDAAGLLQRAGFALPLADAERIVATYASPLAVMTELRAMGMGHGLAERRRRPTRRATLAAASAHYARRFGGPDGRVPVTFELLYLSGWAPHPAQPKPLKPGSAAHRLADALAAAAGPDGAPRGRR